MVRVCLADQNEWSGSLWVGSFLAGLWHEFWGGSRALRCTSMIYTSLFTAVVADSYVSIVAAP